MGMLSPFACDMTAIPTANRAVHHRLIQRLMGEALAEFHQLPDGLAFRFPADQYDSVSAFVGRERLCCPFIRFVIEAEPGAGALWLRLTGPEGAKEFLLAELGLGPQR